MYQMFSHCPLTEEPQVRFKVVHVALFEEKLAVGQDFVPVLWCFPVGNTNLSHTHTHTHTHIFKVAITL